MKFELNGPALIDPELLLQEQTSGRGPVVVDVRTKAEFCEAHIPGARLIPLHQLVGRTCELDTHRAEPIVIVSYDGLRARIAAGALSLAGFAEVAVLDGGVRRWRELGYPLEDTTAAWAHHDGGSVR